jgi:hypothetical protein
MYQVPFINSSRGVPFIAGVAVPLGLYLASDKTGFIALILVTSVISGFVLAALDYSRECQRVRDSLEKWEEPTDEWRYQRVERHSLVRPIRVRRDEQHRKSG